MPQFSHRILASVILVALGVAGLAAVAAETGSPAASTVTAADATARTSELARQLETVARTGAEQPQNLSERQSALAGRLAEVAAADISVAGGTMAADAAEAADAAAPAENAGGVVSAENNPTPPAETGTPAAPEVKEAETAPETPPAAEGEPVAEGAENAPVQGEEATPPEPRMRPEPVTTEANASLATHVRALLRDMKGGSDPLANQGVTSSGAPEKPIAENLSAMSAPPVADAAKPAAPAVEVAKQSPAQVTGDPLSQLVNIDFREMDLTNVVALLANKANINIIAGTDLQGTVTANLQNVPLRQAIETALRMNSLGMIEEEGIYRIVPYDEAVAINSRTEMVVLQNAKAPEVQSVIKELTNNSFDKSLISVSANKTSNVLVITAPKNRITELVELTKQMDLKEPKLPTVTEAIALNYADPDECVSLVQKMLTPQVGLVAADARARHLVVTDIPVVVEQIKQLVTSIDKPVKQVMIETMIVDVVLSDEADTGIKWLMQAVTTHQSNDAYFGPYVKEPAGVIQELGLASDAEVLKSAAGLLNFSLLTDNVDWQGLIQAEVRNRNGRLVSNPIVMTVENQPATISIAQEIPYVELTQTQAGGQQTSTEFKEIGTVLTVTPKVTHDDHIITTIEGKESAVNGEFNGVPIEDKREVSSTMRMANGQTVFIGGLRKSSGSSSARKIPVLGDIPVVNLAFRSNSREERINELLVFVTCNVINEDVPLTDEQKKILNDSKLEEQKVDALETLWYDTKYPQTTKTPQIKWRRGS